VKGIASEVEKGRLTESDAQERAKAVLRAVRFGQNDYVFVYNQEGVNLVLGPRPELEGKNLIENKDPNGIASARPSAAAGPCPTCSRGPEATSRWGNSVTR
jgi:methyl-accepting chemotaxis protein